jgi:hypothetical protein
VLLHRSPIPGMSDTYVAIITVSIVGYALDRAFLAARSRLLSSSTEERAV